MNTEIDHVQTQNCGCKVTHYKAPEKEPFYQPCLPCALINAGLMLQQAGQRVREERQSPMPQAAQDYIDGNKK